MSAHMFFFLTAVVTATLAKSLPHDPDLISQFEDFIKEYDKKYENEIEKAMRFGIFAKNFDIIDHQNKRSDKAMFGITQFADITAEEFIMWHTGRTSLGDETCRIIPNVGNTTADTEFDWRTKGVVSSVKNQGQCGSSWAFSAIGNMEGVNAIKTGKLIELSPQQLVDCENNSAGCHEGDIIYAVAYLKDKGAISNADYPYTAHNGTCKYNKSKVVATPKHCYILTVPEDALAQKLQQMGPLSIAINAKPLVNYKTGILKGSDCKVKGTNHGVLLVGFGEENGTKFWIVKNSWGEKFGEHGYFRMERDVNCLKIMNIPPVSAVM